MFKGFILFCSLALVAISYKVSDFKPSILKPSPPSGFHNVDTGADIEGEILCFGDINGDQYNDYIAVSNLNPLEVLIYFWNEGASQFTKDSLSLQSYNGIVGKIQQILLVDLSDDGSQQIIITYLPSSSVNQSIKTYSTIVFETLECHYVSCRYQLYSMGNAGLQNMTTTPTLINLEGASTAFLVFNESQRYVVYKKQKNNYVKKNFQEYLNDKKPDNFKKVNKHFTSNVDFNGDCHSDLVILSINGAGNHVLQFYQKQTNSKFSFTSEIVFTQSVQFYTFVDFDSSGTVDIVLVAGTPGNQTLYILYNLNEIPTEICKEFSKFPFDVSTLQILPIPFTISSTSILNFGDIDSDSYPDLLTIITSKDFRKAALFKNTNIEGKRSLVPSQDLNANMIFESKNPRQAAFFDLGQDGKLDIIIMVEQSRDSDKSSVVTRSCFFNNVKDDTLFIKILPLSQTSTYEAGSRKISNAFGITIQWRITKLDGYKKISLLNQKSQWNYGTLQLPFSSGGLGRTNNYVQDLTVGYETTGQKISWSPVIPDSKLLVYEKDGAWKLETLLTNNERVNQVVYVSVIILVVLGLIIFFLNYRENQQDKKDQYNFIQLIR